VARSRREDALAYVRFGLRAADDPRILNTVAAIDALLRRELPAGSYWYRYNDDGYGEHAEGTPFDGSGIRKGQSRQRRFGLRAARAKAAREAWRDLMLLTGWDYPACSVRQGLRFCFCCRCRAPKL
jgi:GH15 family glucan-1,4-alpha-glucosidase